MATVPKSPAPPPADQQEVVQAALAAIVGRIRLAIGIRYASWAILIASAMSVLLLILWRFWLPVFPVVGVIAGVYVLALITAFIATLRYPISLIAAARLADERQGLKQRLSSSLALAGEAEWANPTFVRLQTADAASIAAELDTRTTLPLRPTWHAGAALLSLLLVAIATFLALRSIPAAGQNGGPAQVVVAQEGAELARDAHRIAREADAKHMPLTARDAQKLAQLGSQMQSRSVTAQQAQQKIASLSSEVKRDQQQAAQQSSTAAAGQAGSPAGAANRSTQGGHAQGSMGHNGASPGASPADASLGQALQTAARAMNGSRLSPSERQQMAQNLHNLAAQAREAGMNKTARDLDAAAKALAQGKNDEAASELRKAAADSQDEAKAAEAREAAQSTANGQKPGSGNQKAGAQSENGRQGIKPGQNTLLGTHARQSQSEKREGPGQSAAGTQQGQARAASGSEQGEGHSQAASQQGGGQQPGQGQQPGNSAAGQDAQGLERIRNALQQAEQRLSGSSGQSGQSRQTGGGQPTTGQSQSGEGQQSGQARSGSGTQQPGGPHGAQPGGSSQMQQSTSGASKGGGPSNLTEGAGRGAPTSPGKFTPTYSPGQTYETPKENMGVFRGQPRQLDNYKPSSSSRYARMYLPVGSAAGRSTTQSSANPPKGAGSGAQSSTVPYYKVYPQFKKGAESAISKQDIPRAYANKVRQYFQSLTPSGK